MCLFTLPLCRVPFLPLVLVLLLSLVCVCCDCFFRILLSLFPYGFVFCYGSFVSVVFGEIVCLFAFYVYVCVVLPLWCVWFKDFSSFLLFCCEGVFF